MVNKRAKDVEPNVQYEFDMIEWAYERFSGSPKSENERNAYLECFLIHARNLLDFFVKPQNSRTDDVLARHFFENDTQWQQKEDGICTFVKKERDTIHKTVAHLTYERINEKTWDVRRIFNELESAKLMFLEMLATERGGDEN